MRVAPSPRRSTGLREVRGLLAGLFEPRPGIYWPDMVLSAAVAWGAFAGAVAAAGRPVVAPACLVVSVLAMYRAVLFIHELSHLRRGALPGFRTAWDLLVGLPMLVPSFTYVGVHTDHHKRAVYGTPRDPEYLPLAAGPRRRVVAFLGETLLLPLGFVVRFVVVAPLGLLVPRLHRWLERHASSLAINLAYARREPAPRERRHMILLEAGCLVVWGAAASLAAAGVLPWRVFLVWYLVSFGVALINQVRTLAAHRYAGDGREMDVVAQLLDSVTVPGRWWTELWAPVGLRYHALHHYLPDLPYHALGRAHRRLVDVLPGDAPYRRAVERSLPAVLGRLWRAAGRPGGGRRAALDGEGGP